MKDTKDIKDVHDAGDVSAYGSYMNRVPDRRKLTLNFLRDIWKVILGIIAGATIGAVAYLLYHAIADGEIYSGYSEFYIDFTIDENGDAAYDYYNGYTWNDLMTTELLTPYMNEYLAGQGREISVDRLEDIIQADILSDIRLLRVTFSDSDTELCGDVQQAAEYALTSLGNDAREFERISCIKSVAPTRIYADDRMRQAVLLGAIAGLVLTLIVLRFIYILDDRITLPIDIYDTGLKVLSVSMSDGDTELEKRFNEDLRTKTAKDTFIHIDATAFQDIDRDMPELPAARDGEGVIIDVPYKRVTISALKLLADRLRLNGYDIAGVNITDADSRLYRRYYSFGRTKKS